MSVGEGGLQGPLADIPVSKKKELHLLALRLAGTIVHKFHVLWHNLYIDLLRFKI